MNHYALHAEVMVIPKALQTVITPALTVLGGESSMKILDVEFILST